MKLLKWCLLFCISLTLFGCGKEEIVGTEKMAAQVRKLASFSSVNVSGFYTVNITIGSPQSVTLQTNSNLLPYIESDVSGNKLTINAKKGYLLRPSGTPTLDIVVPTLASIELNGNNQVSLKGVAKGDLELIFSGSNQFVGQGSLDTLKMTVDGESNIDASKLVANEVVIVSNGSSKIMVYPKEELNVKISGVGTVNYFGNPKVEQVINGSASIHKMPEIINK